MSKIDQILFCAFWQNGQLLIRVKPKSRQAARKSVIPPPTMEHSVTDAKEYRDFAEECLKWAEEAKDDAQREAFLEMANSWVQAAILDAETRQCSTARRSILRSYRRRVTIQPERPSPRGPDAGDWIAETTSSCPPSAPQASSFYRGWSQLPFYGVAGHNYSQYSRAEPITPPGD